MASFLQRCSDEEKQAWVSAARSEGVSLAGWVRSRLNAALPDSALTERTDKGPDVSTRPPRSVKAKPRDITPTLKAAMPKPSHCPHGLPKGFCLNPRCK